MNFGRGKPRLVSGLVRALVHTNGSEASVRLAPAEPHALVASVPFSAGRVA